MKACVIERENLNKQRHREKESDEQTAKIVQKKKEKRGLFAKPIICDDNNAERERERERERESVC